MSTTTPFDSTYLTQIFEYLTNAIKEQTLVFIRIIWENALHLLATHFIAIFLSILGLLIFALVLALITGRWALFGSLLYNVLYFSVLLIIGLIWGPDAFASDWFDVVRTIAIWPVCYWIVGIVLDKTGLKRIRG
jgi:hypothetical protein